MRYAMLTLIFSCPFGLAYANPTCGKIERLKPNFNASPVMVDVFLDSGRTVSLYVDAMPTLASAMAGNLIVCLDPQSQRFPVAIFR